MELIVVFRKLLRSRKGNFAAGVALLSPMLIGAAGLVVDYTHAMQQKANVEAAIDAAVLSTAKVDLVGIDLEERFKNEFYGMFGEISPEFSKFDVKISADVGLNYVNMQASVDASLKTRFIHLLGSDSFDFRVTGGAYEAKSNIEIALVLDISSSMNNKKMAELQGAATQFVNTVLTDEAVKEGRVSISLVPYGGSVRLPEDMAEDVSIVTNETHWKDAEWNGCLQYDSKQFNAKKVKGETFDYIPHHYKWNKNNDWCPKEGNELVGPTNDRDALLATIKNFQRSDGTGTDHGALWGLKTLSPDLEGDIPGAIKDRPLAYDKDNLKYMIVMTDGGITAQFVPNDYKEGAKKGFLKKLLAWLLKGKAVKAPKKTMNKKAYNAGQARRNFTGVCTLAKNSGVTVFTIGFAVPDNWKLAELRACASTKDKYYNVGQSDLTKTFEKIAAEMQPVRLTN